MKRKIITMLTTFAFLLTLSSQNVMAKETETDNYKDYIKVINNDTQKEVNIEIKEVITTTSPVISTRSTLNNSDDFVKEVEIKFNIPELKGASTRSYDDTSKNYGDFVAYLRIDYQKAGTPSLPQIKITSVQGSWKCTATGYSARFENKEVLVRQGNWFYDPVLIRNPSGDSFYYSTGWGFADDLPKTSYSGVWATSTAKATINGMGGGYTIVTQMSN